MPCTARTSDACHPWATLLACEAALHLPAAPTTESAAKGMTGARCSALEGSAGSDPMTTEETQRENTVEPARASRTPPCPGVSARRGGAGRCAHCRRDHRLGGENLLEPEQLSTLEGEDVGLITNPTGTDSSLRSTIDLLIEAQDEGGFTLTTLYGPEHGVRGAEPAGGEVEDYIDEKTGLP